MSTKKILVLGGGIGGYTAAFLAADLGMEVVLVDAGSAPGGVCLNRGCIPSKALLHLSRLIHEARDARSFGIEFSDPQIRLDEVRGWKDRIVSQLASGIVTLARQRKIKWINQRGTFIDSHTLSLEGGEKLGYDHAIVATGSSPTVPQVFGKSSDARIMSSDTALDLPEIPSSLLVVGGGYIGLELGSVYAAFGSRVSVVEMTETLLPGVDKDLIRILQHRLRKSLAEIHLSTQVAEVKPENEGIKVRLSGESSVDAVFDRVLYAVGRTPNSAGLGLDKTRVALDAKGFIRVDGNQQTADPALYAVGDVAGGAMLAHKAACEARRAVETIHGGVGGSAKEAVVPAVVFTDPEVAWCGLTETQAEAEGRKITVAKFPWGASGRAVALGRGEGFSKWIVDSASQRILGGAVVGYGAGDLIAEAVLAVERGLTVAELASCMHPHPTLSETWVEAAEVFLGTATHFISRKK